MTGADRDRAQLAEERFGPPLSDEQVWLLAAVRDQRVHRFRRSSTTTIGAGDDLVDRGGGAAPPRRVNPRMRALLVRGLVVLRVPREADLPDAGQARYACWPWELTSAGETALARATSRRKGGPR